MGTSEVKKYKAHKRSARERDIGFLLTFDEWIKIWMDSGHWHQRGRRVGEYCMARPGDQGTYEVGNVKIILHSENSSDRLITPAMRAHLRRVNVGNKNRVGKSHTTATKEKLSKAALGNKRCLGRRLSIETKEKISRSRLGGFHA